MDDARRLYLTKERPEVCAPPCKAGPSTVIVRMSEQDTSQGGIILPFSGRMSYDVGTVVSVGKKYEGTFFVGQFVAVRPGDGAETELDGIRYKFVHDRFDQYTGEHLYDVLDQIPIYYHEKPRACDTWTLLKPKPRATVILTSETVVTDMAEDENGDNWAFKVEDENDALGFLNAEAWGLEKNDKVVKETCLLARLVRV